MKRRNFLATTAAFCLAPSLPKPTPRPMLPETNWCNLTFEPDGKGGRRIGMCRWLSKQEVLERYGVKL